MAQRWHGRTRAMDFAPAAKRRTRHSPSLSAARHLTLALVVAGSMAATGTAGAQSYDCDAYARAYANAHVDPGATDLDIYDKAARGAVAGGLWDGALGAQRGAAIGGALSVLNTLGNTPSGWHGLYDLAHTMCMSAQSPVNHRPRTLGDPSYRATPLDQPQWAVPALEPRPQLAPQLASPPPPPPPAAPRP